MGPPRALTSSTRAQLWPTFRLLVPGRDAAPGQRTRPAAPVPALPLQPLRHRRLHPSRVRTKRPDKRLAPPLPVPHHPNLFQSVHSRDPVNKTRRHTNCPYENKNKLTATPSSCSRRVPRQSRRRPRNTLRPPHHPYCCCVQPPASGRSRTGGRGPGAAPKSAGWTSRSPRFGL